MFIELNKFNVQNERRDGKATMEATPGFLTWKVGYKVKNKKGGMEAWGIKAIAGSTDKSAVMRYDVEVELVSEEGEETKLLKGATLQSGYTFLSGTEEEEKQRTTHAITVHIYGISRFEARTRGRPGSRVFFQDKVVNIVAESYDEIKARIAAATPPKPVLRSTAGIAGASIATMDTLPAGGEQTDS
jgi:hypothetical protein